MVHNNFEPGNQMIEKSTQLLAIISSSKVSSNVAITVKRGHGGKPDIRDIRGTSVSICLENLLFL